MTNRERAIAIWRRQGGLGDDFRPEDWPEEIDPLVADLDAAERRGALAGRLDEVRALLKSTVLLTRDLDMLLRLRVAELESELKAEENTR